MRRLLRGGTRALIARYSVTDISTQPRSEFRSEMYRLTHCFGDEALKAISHLSLRSRVLARGAVSRVF